MGKGGLKKYIVKRTGVTAQEAGLLVDVFMDGIVESILKEGKATLPNFGTFKIKRTEARTARNPRTGEKVFVPDRNVIRFKPARKLKTAVLTKE
jgi:nucleoid DNA-binding protein